MGNNGTESGAISGSNAESIVNGKTMEQIENETVKKIEDAYDVVVKTFDNTELVDEVWDELQDEASYNWSLEELDGMTIDDWVNEFEFILEGYR